MLSIRLVIAPFLIVVGLLMHNHASAYQIIDFSVTEDNKVYKVYFHVEVPIESKSLSAHITDIDNIATIIPSLEHVKVVKRDDGRTQVNATMRPCILFICKRLYKRSIVEIEDNQLQFTGFKNAGSFVFINEKLVVKQISENTSQMYYHSEFSPAFAMPSFFGIIVIKQSINKYLVQFLQQLESTYAEEQTSTASSTNN